MAGEEAGQCIPPPYVGNPGIGIYPEWKNKLPYLRAGKNAVYENTCRYEQEKNRHFRQYRKAGFLRQQPVENTGKQGKSRYLKN